MAHQVDINLNLDSDIKERMEAVCDEMGISLSTAFTMFATKVGREGRIPFELSLDPFYSQENIERLERNRNEMETTGGTIHNVEEYEEIFY